MSKKYFATIMTTIMAMAESLPMADTFSSGMPNYQCSINEITEKSNVTEKEVLELLEAGIISGKNIFGVPFIIDDTPYSVEKKLNDWKKGGKINECN